MAEPSWGLLYQAALAEFLRHLGTSPRSETSRDPNVTWVVTGVWSNTHNGVAGTRLPTSSTADDTICDVLERFRLGDVPGAWYVCEGDLPDDLSVRLERHGADPERSGVVMGAPRATLERLSADPPPDVGIVEVLDGNSLDQWFDAAARVWLDGADARDREVRRALYASLGLGPERRWRHWVALSGPVPVGTVSAFYTREAIAVENVGVVPSNQRRGLGRALTLTPVHAARSGAPWVVLGPSPEGTPLYRALGFTTQPCPPNREFYLPARGPNPSGQTTPRAAPTVEQPRPAGLGPAEG